MNREFVRVNHPDFIHRSHLNPCLSPSISKNLYGFPLYNGKYDLNIMGIMLLTSDQGFLYFALYLFPMELMMYLGNDLIESIPIHFDQLSQPGYLGKFKRVLKEKHAELIQQSASHPEFLVINPTPPKRKYEI
jgi:hypothetical protein